VSQFKHRTASWTGRRKIPEELRTPWISEATALMDALATARKAAR
jgi:hypothetical protein